MKFNISNLKPPQKPYKVTIRHKWRILRKLRIDDFVFHIIGGFVIIISFLFIYSWCLHDIKFK